MKALKKDRLRYLLTKNQIFTLQEANQIIHIVGLNTIGNAVIAAITVCKLPVTGQDIDNLYRNYIQFLATIGEI